MSYNVLVESSIWNCNGQNIIKLLEHLHDKFPERIGDITTDDGDLIIRRDFSAEITEEVLKFRRDIENGAV